MNNFYHRGNTLMEYALMGGMVVLASWAALFMLGDSIGGLTGELNRGQSKQKMENLVSLNFSGGNGNTSGGTSGGNQVSDGAPGRGANGGGLNLTESATGGQNVTSADGKIVVVGSPTFKATIGLALQVKELAEETGNPDVLHIAKLLNWSGMAQGTYEYQNGDTSPQLAEMKRISTAYQGLDEGMLKESSLKSIGLWNDQLTQRANALSTSRLSREQTAMLLSAVQQVVQKTKTTYGAATLDAAVNNSTYKQLSSPTSEAKDELVGQMWEASKATLTSGAANNHDTLKSTLQKALETKAASEQ